MHLFSRQSKPLADHFYYSVFNADPLCPMSVSLATSPEGEVKEAWHYHTQTQKIFLTIDGEGVLMVEGREIRMHVGELIHVEPGEKHAVVRVTKGPMRYAVVRSQNIDDKVTLEVSA